MHMKPLVFVELADGQPRKSSLEAICYARTLAGASVKAVALGTADQKELSSLGRYGVSEVLHCPDSRFDQGHPQALTSALHAAAVHSSADAVVMAGTSLSTPAAARLSLRMGASLLTGISSLPAEGVYRRPIFTGKAFADVRPLHNSVVITLRKNAVTISETNKPAPCSRHNMRNAELVIPAIGANTTGGSIK